MVVAALTSSLQISPVPVGGVARRTSTGEYWNRKTPSGLVNVCGLESVANPIDDAMKQSAKTVLTESYLIQQVVQAQGQRRMAGKWGILSIRPLVLARVVGHGRG
jgi:hypothetical protein